MLMMNTIIQAPSDIRKKLAMALVGGHHNSNECGSWIHKKKYVRQQNMAEAIRKRGVYLHLHINTETNVMIYVLLEGPITGSIEIWVYTNWPWRRRKKG